MKYIALLVAFLATGCVEERTQKEAATDTEMLSATSDEQIKGNAKSIEQAADEAVRLIEAEAKAETDKKLLDGAEQ